MCDVTHLHVCHESSACVTWLICARDVTHFCVWHDSFVRVPWVVYVCAMTHVSMLTCVETNSADVLLFFWKWPWLMQWCDVTHSCVWYDPCIRAPWLNSGCDMSPSCVRLDSCKCVTWLIHLCNMRHDLCTRVTRLIIWVTCRIHVCDMTYAYVRHDSLMRDRLWMYAIWRNHVWVMSRTHGIHESCHELMVYVMNVCVTAHACLWHDSSVCVTWLIHVRVMTHSSVWRASCMHVSRLIHVYDTSHSFLWRDSFHVCVMTHPYAWLDSYMYVTQRIYMCDVPCPTHPCDMIHQRVWHESHMCDVTHFTCVTRLTSHVWHDSMHRTNAVTKLHRKSSHG